jgi:hypothetical protein
MAILMACLRQRADAIRDVLALFGLPFVELTMKLKSQNKWLLSGAKSEGLTPSVSTTDDECPKVSDAFRPADTRDFPEAHDDPEQSEELERQQDA